MAAEPGDGAGAAVNRAVHHFFVHRAPQEVGAPFDGFHHGGVVDFVHVVFVVDQIVDGAELVGHHGGQLRPLEIELVGGVDADGGHRHGKDHHGDFKGGGGRRLVDPGGGGGGPGVL